MALLLALQLGRKLAEANRRMLRVDASYWWLSAYMVTSVLIFLLLAISSQTHSLPLAFKLFAGGAGFMLLPAFFFTYILSLVGKSTRWALLFTLPFVLLYSWQNYVGLDNDKFSFYHGLTVATFSNEWEQWLSLVIYSTQIVFPILGLHQIEKHQEKILDSFSNLNGIDLVWIQKLLWGILIVLLFAMLSVIPLGDATLIPINWSLPLLFMLVSIQLVYVAHYGLNQSSIFSCDTSIQGEQEVSEEETLADVVPEDLQQRVSQLDVFMQETKIYRKSRLTIEDLSQNIGWSTENISETINKGFERNFFEFVNFYRIEAVKQELEQDKNRQATLLNIALHCGFNSKTAFNTTFKKLTGVTPSTYRQILKKERAGNAKPR